MAAVKRIESWLYASLPVHQTIGVETVLSTDKYRCLVSKAKSYRFEFRLIYVLLDSVERNVSRVAMRRLKRGHDVPESKIRERHDRSIAQLPWFIEQADRAYIFDNSGDTPRKIGQKIDGSIEFDPVRPAALDMVLEKLQRGILD
ncbi:MAG: hypothetical protein SFV21_06935 [Rhodospirillaceae bacterium]|nr:hypothetical protein [Rhodospirillaceae bacterium]